MSMAESMIVAADRLKYDPCTGFLTWKTSLGSRSKVGARAGSVNGIGYRVIGINGRDLLAHRIAWFIHAGTIPCLIDHIDGDRDNNAILNLREATKSLNGANRGKQANNSSGYKGVKKRYHRWIAQIHVGGRNRYLGSFSSPEDASSAYERAALAEYGEFAHAEGVMRTQHAIREMGK